ncbi:hypothetical protein K443DRAFT_102718, partial [Laccaria amethystina LaAM-08-1]
FRKLKERATTFVSWEKSPKKESAYPKREMYTTTKFMNRLQKTTKFKHRLQILPIDYKKLQKSDIDFKTLLIPITPACFSLQKFSSVRFFSLQKFVVSAFFITKVCNVRFLRVQKFVVSAFSHYKSLYCLLFHCKSL